MVLTVDFVLDGQQFTAINGGPQFTFDEAISLLINCADQDEIDYYWAKLTEGGEEGPCGWLKDKYGLSWQVVPGRHGRDAERPRPGARAAGDEGHARHEEDRHRRAPRGRRRGLTASRQPQIALARARALSASDLSVAYGSPAMSPAMRVSGVRGCESRYVMLASCFTRDAMK